MVASIHWSWCRSTNGSSLLITIHHAWRFKDRPHMRQCPIRLYRSWISCRQWKNMWFRRISFSLTGAVSVGFADIFRLTWNLILSADCRRKVWGALWDSDYKVYNSVQVMSQVFTFTHQSLLDAQQRITQRVPQSLSDTWLYCHNQIRFY